jgi:hypothetical protein
MNVPTRSMRLFGILLFSMGAVRCAQPAASDIGLPTAPSSLSAGPSASLVPSGGIATLGPGASYNASGMWRFVTTDIHGNDDDSFDTNVSQDGNGNLSFLDDDGSPVTLERLGTGVIITYRLSQTGSEEGTECDIHIQGTARLDTRTNTITMKNLLLRELGCSRERLRLFVTATKLS